MSKQGDLRMELKRILAPDVRTALRLVREELGAEAMIFSNRRVSGGVEIIASAQGNGAPPRSTESELASPVVADTVAEIAPFPAAPAFGREPPRGDADVAPRLAEVQSELRRMRDLLETRLVQMDRGRAGIGPGIQARLRQRLTRIGLPNRIVRELVGRALDDADWETAWLDTLCALAAQIPEAGDPVAGGGTFAVVGPAGAGKTTTLCKLAVRYALEHGPEAVALISLDSYRLGATDMLRAVAGLLGADFHAAGADEPVADILVRCSAKRLILIDTPGLNRRISSQVAQLEHLGRMAGAVATLLVLPANAQRRSLEAVIQDCRIVSPVGCVLTKIDETASMGEAIGAISAAALPVAYSTDGQEIPDDIHIARASELVSHAVALESGEGNPGAPENDDAAPGECSAVADSVGRSARESFAAPRGIAARIG
jgi:flagellar biosynthesis protein FlhF